MLLLVLLAAALIGCGGGGGGGGDGGDADPLAPETNARVDEFLKAINAEDVDTAMSFIDSNMKWHHVDGVWNHDDVKRHLQDLFASASQIDVRIDTREVVSDLESYALFAGRLSGSWTDNGGVSRSLPTENVEIHWSRVPAVWGIQTFCGHAGGRTQFPPGP